VRCKCGAQARKNQRTCPACHRAYMRRARGLFKKEIEELRAQLARVLGDDVETKRRFAEQFSTRKVILDDGGRLTNGEVVGFLPGDYVRVHLIISDVIKPMKELKEDKE
jgi:hypothetical protein